MSAVVQRLVTGVPGEIGPARVVGLRESGAVEIEFADRDTAPTLATVVSRTGDMPAIGDTVLVATGRLGERYVIGVFGSVIRTVEGASAEVSGPPGRQAVSVRDTDGKLLFEYQASCGRSVVHAPSGDLQFAADAGSIRFVARDTVTMHGERVHLEGTSSVQCKTPHLDAVAHRADLSADAATLTARTVHTTAEKVRELYGALETHATRIVERARNVYRDAEELAQMKAGRMRVLVKSTYQLIGKRTLLRAEEDVRVDGEKIYLG